MHAGPVGSRFSESVADSLRHNGKDRATLGDRRFWAFSTASSGHSFDLELGGAPFALSFASATEFRGRETQGLDVRYKPMFC